MAVISLPVSPLIEEFFNKNHSRQDGKFTSGGGGGGKRTMSLESSTSGQAGKAVRTGTGAATHTRLSTDNSTSGTPGSFRRGANARLAPAAAVGTTRDGKFVSPGQLAHEKQKAGGTLTAHEGQMARAHQGLQPGVIRDGKVHVDGVAVTTRIGKQGSDIWHAKMTAKHGGGDVSGNTRAELGRNVTEHIAERAAQGRVGMKKAGLATTTQRDSDGARLNRMSAVHAEKLSGIGASRIGDVSVGRGGVVKVKGKATEFVVSKGSHSKTFKSGFHVSGISDNRGYPKFFSTQAAAKREIAKNVSLASGI